jgi:hypothetical protein
MKERQSLPTALFPIRFSKPSSGVTPNRLIATGRARRWVPQVRRYSGGPVPGVRNHRCAGVPACLWHPQPQLLHQSGRFQPCRRIFRHRAVGPERAGHVSPCPAASYASEGHRKYFGISQRIFQAGRLDTWFLRQVPPLPERRRRRGKPGTTSVRVMGEGLGRAFGRHRGTFSVPASGTAHAEPGMKRTYAEREIGGGLSGRSSRWRRGSRMC